MKAKFVLDENGEMERLIFGELFFYCYAADGRRVEAMKRHLITLASLTFNYSQI